MLGKPLYPQCQKPSKLVPTFLAGMGALMIAAGMWIGLTPGDGSCRGKGAALCKFADSLHQLLFGASNERVAEAAVWVALGVLVLAAARHIKVMWFRRAQ